MGRGSSGVKGIELGANDKVIGSEEVLPEEEILIVTENGYGKKTSVENYRLTHRGSKGVSTLKETEKNGELVALRSIIGTKDVLIVSDSGITIRIKSSQISTLGRNTQGVRLINLKDNQKVTTVAILEESEEELDEPIENNEEVTE
jgi:DNA gyrase subunit A